MIIGGGVGHSEAVERRNVLRRAGEAPLLKGNYRKKRPEPRRSRGKPNSSFVLITILADVSGPKAKKKKEKRRFQTQQRVPTKHWWLRSDSSVRQGDF